MEAQLTTIPNGEAGTDATLQRMGELVQASLRRPSIRLHAIQILNEYRAPDRDEFSQAAALVDWVRKNIRYISDPVEVETVQSPMATLEVGAGDCDDHAVIVVALAESIGLRGRFRVIGTSPDQFQHVYPELLVGGQWCAADSTTPGGAPSGVLPVTKVYSSKGSVMTGVNNLGFLNPAAVYSAGKVVSSIFGGGDEPAPVWNRMQHIRVGETLQPGGKPVDQAFANGLNAQWDADIFIRQRPANPDIWAIMPAGTFEEAYARNQSGGNYNSNPIPSAESQPIFGINIPSGMIQTTVPPDSARAGVSQAVSDLSPVAIGLLAVGALFVLPKLIGGKK